jgi:hypothetical protein
MSHVQSYLKLTTVWLLFFVQGSYASDAVHNVIMLPVVDATVVATALQCWRAGELHIVIICMAGVLDIVSGSEIDQIAKGTGFDYGILVTYDAMKMAPGQSWAGVSSWVARWIRSSARP